ncbi:diguanylate cyclase [Magnetospirillum sp. 64-120]|uniref:GGDEF domain-containing protein n=1 Tax=Magnetospirillum sp. 64-120 TaxID=1895778 RepID=UPI000B025EAF|nr:GGDEF domain-containing protein [Magnetospirillum sp. 64-120]
MPFDSKTLWLALTASNLVFGLIMLVYSGALAERRILRIWAVGQVVKGLGILMILLKPALPPWLSPVANSILYMGHGLELLAFSLYSGHVRMWRGVLALTALAVIAQTTAHQYLGAGVTPVHMAVLFSLIVVLYTGGNAWVIATARRRMSPIQTVLVFSNTIIAVAALVRAWAAANSTQWAPGANLPLNQALFAVAFVSSLADGFSFLLLVKEDADRDLLRLATTDSLTGLANRRFFLDRTEAVWRLHVRLGKPMSLMMLDIDHFKSLNDRYGHAVGDQALRCLGAVLPGCLREVDICGRLGGEEFAVALPGSNLAEARAVAERIRLALEAIRLDTAHGDVGFTASFGIALIEPEQGIEPALSQADHQLYLAKESGRNRVA